MASPRRVKEALRIAAFAYFAGAHYTTEEVERMQSLSPKGNDKDAAEMRQTMLDADYERFHESMQNVFLFCDILDEEGLYPFGSEWPRDALEMLSKKIIPPQLSLE